MAQAQTPKNYARNLAALAGDYISFMVALAFIDDTTIMPSFASQLTSSAPLIGLVSTIHNGAWLLPQLFAANYVSHKPRKKPFIILPVCIGRPVIPLMAVAIYFLAGSSPMLTLGLLYVAQAIFWSMDGLASVPWFDVLAKVFPGRMRGRYLAISQVGGGILGIGAGMLVKRILSPDSSLAFPGNYALLFILATVFLAASLISIQFVREPVESTHAERASWGQYFAMLRNALRDDRRFSLAIAGRLLGSFGGMALPFYILYATEGLSLGPSVVGLCVTAKIVGGILGGVLLGLSVEKMGNRFTILAATALTACVPLFALLFGLLGPSVAPSILAYVYPLLFVLVGISLSSLSWSFTHYILDIAPPKDRTTYVGLTNTLNGLVIVAPVLGGALLEATSYGVLFATSLAVFVAALVIALRLPAVEGQLAAEA